ncbi:hypothetical protein DFH09DRAFT_939041 [Mycena vulgaris]|nr:hypothetical protein DFH09DRAFT_939041 [Mycena vulgaris]
MVIDMKVRWSSTYAMLDRAYALKEISNFPSLFLRVIIHDARQDVDKFVFEIVMDEIGEKRTKIAALQLTETEWKRVDLFLKLLAYAEKSQHKFSSDLKFTLHLALPTLETLHADWTRCAADPLYSDFVAAPEQALEKVDEYILPILYCLTTIHCSSVLDPEKKLSYLRAHWPAEPQESAVESMEETFKQRYLKLHGPSSAAPLPVKKAIATKLRRSVVREDDETTNGTETHIDPLKPSLDEYQQYLTAREVVPVGMDTIQWWGVSVENTFSRINAARYPVWASLARDYLA